MSYLWQAITGAFVIYVVAQIVRDFRRGDYVMAGLGAALLVTILIAPIQTHAVLLDQSQAGSASATTSR